MTQAEAKSREKAAVGKRKPGARKAEILDVAGALFHKSGFHNVGMDDIGEAAGVTGPALYFHFSSKTGLLAAIMERLADQRQLRDRQRAYVARWVDALRAYNPDLDQAEALSIVHGVFNFIASIAFYEPRLEQERLRDLLERKASACLLDRSPTTRRRPSRAAKKTTET